MRFLGLGLSHDEERVLSKADVKTELEQQRLENARLEVKLKKTELNSNRIDLAGRAIFAIVVFGLMGWWLVFVQYVIRVVAFNKAHLSDAVLIALITTTTANVIGLWVIVANYLYYRAKNSDAVKNKAAAKEENPKATASSS